MIHKKYNLWRINGFHRQKTLFFLSCLLIYPIFRRNLYERLVQQTIESLAVLRHNLLKIVRHRQNSIAVLYIKYHKVLPKIVDELSAGVIEQEINQYTFNNVELEIEGILQLINSNVNYNHQMALEYNRILTWSEQEYNNVVQAYHSHYSKIVNRMRKYPWKYLFEIFDIGELELIY